MSDNTLEDLAEWKAIAHLCLDDHTAPSFALEAAFLALRRDDPKLAQDCWEAALRRKKQNVRNN
jgi:hypothetical protein